MVVPLGRNVSRAPTIPFQLPDQIHAASKDEQLVLFEILFHPRDPRKQILIHARVHKNTVFAEKLRHAFGISERFLVRRRIDQRVDPSVAAPVPADLVTDPRNFFRMPTDILPRSKVFRHRVNVPVVIDRIPMTGQGIV